MYYQFITLIPDSKMKALLSYRFNAIIFIFLSIALLSSNANAQTVEPADPSLLELLGVPVEEDEVK